MRTRDPEWKKFGSGIEKSRIWDPHHLTHLGYVFRKTCVLSKTLTLFDDEEAKGEDHGVAGEDVVPAVDVLPVDGQPHTGHQHEHTLHDH
jgi:hypothetical protein